MGSCCHTLLRDLEFLKVVIGVKRRGDALVALDKRDGFTTADWLEACVGRSPDDEALVFEGQSWSFKELDENANRVANWGVSAGLAAGDTVGLLMENSAAFIFFVFGLSKLGASAALINHNLTGGPFAHCVEQTGCKALIFDTSLCATIGAYVDSHGGGMRMFCYGSVDSDAPAFALEIDPFRGHAASSVPRELRAGVRITDTLFHIFTSGTTGLPKAARIHHLKAMLAGVTMYDFHRVGKGDRVYLTLPLYHSSAMLIGVFGCAALGLPLLLRRRFSASQFFSDCARLRATVVLYIGEICRYLCATPPGPHDRAHSVRAAIGNGLRPDVWEQLVERFSIRYVGEFYASTEGNANLINNQNRRGAIGFISPLIKRKYPVKIVRFDVERERVVRDAAGRCVEAAAGEVGELLGLIDNADVTRRFDGYTDRAATEKKILRDVAAEGDLYFSTGDLVRQDAEGFVYFVDRIGDTFRWKGENVSTAEVAEILSAAPGVSESTVYGVSVGSLEGRAGMAALVVEAASFRFEALAQTVASLPRYARPLFVRLLPALELTATFKIRKGKLVEQGFDPAVVSDVWLYEEAAGAYRPLDVELHRRLVSGQVKL